MSYENPDTPTDSNDARSESVKFEGVEGLITYNNLPVSNVFVQAISLDTPQNLIPEIAIVSDSNGFYQWPLSPGRYQIQVSHDRYNSIAKPVIVEENHSSTLNFEFHNFISPTN